MIVVPIPARSGSARASSWIVRLAASIVSRRTRSGGAVGQLAVEGLGGGLGGDLAGLGAAHPVGDDEERRADEERVLVGVALAAGVGAEGLVVDRSIMLRRLEPELGVADLHRVAVDQLRLALQGRRR